MARYRKTIVCLANSKKNGGRCVAAREWNDDQPGDWIRPVSNKRGEELPISWLKGKGGDPFPLEKYKISLSGPTHNIHQPENWLFDEADRWMFRGCVRWDDLHKMADPVADMWGLGHSSHYGMNDIIDSKEKVNSTLRLVRVPEMQLSVFWYRTVDLERKRQVRARFMYNNQEYGLKVTDAYFDKELKKMGVGEYEIDECYVTISIVGPYDNKKRNDQSRYGVVAAIIKPE